MWVQTPPAPARLRFGIKFVLLARRWRQALDQRLAEVGLSDATWAPLVHLWESGGGISQVFTRPSFQTGCGVPAGTMRLVPDVALEADTTPGNYVVKNGGWYIVGGTSGAAPQWAGHAAQLNQKFGGGGHSQSAGVRVKNKPMQQVIDETVAAAQEHLRAIGVH